MEKYRCIKDLYVDDYDDNGFATGGWTCISVGSIWEKDESPYRIAGGNDTIHLDLVTEEHRCQWIEILNSTLKEHFELLS